jgi:predicted RNase H-like HicB family nuclease
MPTKPERKTLSLRINVLVERQANGSYLAHCAELDLVAEGASVSEACAELLNVVDVQVRTCLQNDNLENLFFPAPKEVWEKLGRAQAGCSEQSLQRTIPAEGKSISAVELDQHCYA